MEARQRMNLRRYWERPPAVEIDGVVHLRPRRGASVHLGCGDRYLRGYLNIDLPPSEGVASGTSRPDVVADINRLDAPKESLSEIRLHHVFEHFERAEATALLIKWHSWLQTGGTLVLETPDFERCVDRFSSRTHAEQVLILRHIFGSQEAPWALHKDGWSASRFESVLGALGFKSVRSERTFSDSAGLLANVVITAERAEGAIAWDSQLAAGVELLRLGMNGQNSTEEKLLSIWREKLLRALA